MSTPVRENHPTKGLSNQVVEIDGDTPNDKPDRSRPSLQALLHALQTLQHYRDEKHRRDGTHIPQSIDERPIREGKSKDNIVKILNLFTLPLVTRNSGDYAAVAIVINPSDLEVVFSKNMVLTEPETKYIEGLASLIREIARQPGDNPAGVKVFTHILSGCREKVLSRMTKLKIEIERSLEDIKRNCRHELEVSPRGRNYENIMRNERFRNCFDIREYSNDTSDPPLPEILPQLLRVLLEFSESNSIECLRTVVWASFYLGDNSLLGLVGPVLVRRLKKLGDYHLSVRVILHYANNPRYKKKVAKMKVLNILQSNGPTKNTKLQPHLQQTDHTSHSLSPVPSKLQSTVLQNDYCIQKEHEVLGDTQSSPITVLDILNAAAELSENPFATPVTRDNILALYPGFVDNPWYSREADLKLHCECRLALFLTERFPMGQDFEIGTSKPCCWACDEWFEACSDGPRTISSTTTTFHKRRTDWKVQPDWLSPGPARADALVYNAAFDRVLKEHSSIRQKRARDAHALKSLNPPSYNEDQKDTEDRGSAPPIKLRLRIR
ncbi:hypothetical protein TWF506_008317 [Arthrobotrys conoides]|uniref:Uncharacterized protein n=1 Tax=Arthrobotrys conoides TaxID=74498 RepID=A0AAN8NEB3_9PEZI